MKRVLLSDGAKRLLRDLTRAWLLKHGELGAGFDADCVAKMRSAGVLSNSTEHLHSMTLAKQRERRFAQLRRSEEPYEPIPLRGPHRSTVAVKRPLRGGEVRAPTRRSKRQRTCERTPYGVRPTYADVTRDPRGLHAPRVKLMPRAWSLLVRITAAEIAGPDPRTAFFHVRCYHLLRECGVLTLSSHRLTPRFLATLRRFKALRGQLLAAQRGLLPEAEIPPPPPPATRAERFARRGEKADAPLWAPSGDRLQVGLSSPPFGVGGDGDARAGGASADSSDEYRAARWCEAEETADVLRDAGVGALEHAAPALQADKEVVLAAVAQNGRALKHAAPALQADKEFMLAAVAQNSDALKHAAPALQADKEVVLAAVARNSDALKLAAPALRADPVFQSLAAAKTTNAELRASMQRRDERLAAAEITIAELRAAAQPEVIDLTADGGAEPPPKRRRVAERGGGLVLAAQVTTQLFEAKLRKGEADAAAEQARAAAAAAEAQLEAEQDRHLCVACQAMPLSVVCLPCRHFSLCATCVQDKRATAGGCPMCRAAITELISVYQ
jgi:hypothetical protein